MMAEEISTIIELSCNSAHVGQLTLLISSLYDSFRKLVNADIVYFLGANVIDFSMPVKYFFIFNVILIFGTGREIRTPINGFGDRYSTIELCP